MEIELKDVLCSYIGCECETPNGIQKLVAINLLGNRKNILTLDGGKSVTNAFSYDEVKPILRLLSDITDEEKIAVARLVLYRYQKHYPEPVKLEVKGASVIVLNDNFVHQAQVVIEKDGVYYSGGLTLEDRTYFVPNQYKVTAYLLKQKFDLFGLIESSQALDKTKI